MAEAEPAVNIDLAFDTLVQLEKQSLELSEAHSPASEYLLQCLAHGVGAPDAETSRAICSMIFGGVFERYPKLRVAFAHGGGSFPITVGRIEHGFNVRPDLCAIDNNVNPRDYLGRFWIDALVHDPKALDFILDVMGHDKICMGSDYPFPLGEHRPGALIESTLLPNSLKEKLLFQNALEWLGR